jgi:transcriptional regulator with XRE-family HTH domain
MQVLTDEQTRQNIARNLQRILAARDISQRKLAEMTGEPVMNVSRAVRGENVVNVATIARIAEALDVSIDRLVLQPAEIIPKSVVAHIDSRTNFGTIPTSR